MERDVAFFGGEGVRRVWVDEDWFFSVVDVVGVLSPRDDSGEPSGSNRPRKYWSDLRKKLIDEGFQLSDFVGQLKMKSSDGKMYMTDCANMKGIFRIVQSIPSRKAEPFKIWLAKVASERVEEMEDPEKAIDRAMKNYLAKGYSEKWINQRIKTIEVRKELTDEWKRVGVREGEEFAVLTNEITLAWSGKSIRDYKDFKSLKKENLRDNMTEIIASRIVYFALQNKIGIFCEWQFPKYSIVVTWQLNRSNENCLELELALNTLAEATVNEISKKENPDGFGESLGVAKRGGGVAGNARKEIEREIGEKIVSSKNFKSLEIGENIKDDVFLEELEE